MQIIKIAELSGGSVGKPEARQRHSFLYIPLLRPPALPSQQKCCVM